MITDKLLTVVVPTYNTEKLLPRCLDSLIVEDFMSLLEVLVIIDGSPDNSVEVAEKYASLYPDTFIVINKENGGHGSTINKGIELATGKYFKVLDSDDWFDREVFSEFLEELQTINVDIILTDYTKEYVYENKKEVVKLNNVLYENIYIVKDFDLNKQNWDFASMARSTYKTIFLKRIELLLPENTFYVDTILSIAPLFYFDNFVYINKNLYKYFIGRQDQSMNQDNILKNRDHIKKNYSIIVTKFNKESQNISKNRKLFLSQFLANQLTNIYILKSQLSYKQAKKELRDWNQYVKKTAKKTERINSRFYVLYNLLPFWLYKQLFNLYSKVRNKK